MPSDDRALTDEVIARWHELVRDLDYADPGLERLRRVTIYGDRRVVNVVRPHFLTRARLETQRLAVALTAGALRKVIGVVRAEPAFLDEIGASDGERTLAAIDPGFSDYLDILDRYDAFATRGMRFVEVQGGAPGGPGYHDEEAEAFQQTVVHERLASEYRIEPLLVVPCLLDALIATWHDWGGSGDPTIAIVDWERRAADARVRADPRPLPSPRHQHRSSATPASCGSTAGGCATARTRSTSSIAGWSSTTCIARPDDAAVLVEAMRARRSASSIRSSRPARPQVGLRPARGRGPRPRPDGRREQRDPQPHPVDTPSGRRRRAHRRLHDRTRRGARGGAHGARPQTGPRLRRPRRPPWLGDRRRRLARSSLDASPARTGSCSAASPPTASSTRSTSPASRCARSMSTPTRTRSAARWAGSSPA